MKKTTLYTFKFTVCYQEEAKGQILKWETQIEIPKNSRKMAARLGWMRFTTTVEHANIVIGSLE